LSTYASHLGTRYRLKPEHGSNGSKADQFKVVWNYTTKAREDSTVNFNGYYQPFRWCTFSYISSKVRDMCAIREYAAKALTQPTAPHAAPP